MICSRAQYLSCLPTVPSESVRHYCLINFIINFVVNRCTVKVILYKRLYIQHLNNYQSVYGGILVTVKLLAVQQVVPAMLHSNLQKTILQFNCEWLYNNNCDRSSREFLKLMQYFI